MKGKILSIKKTTISKLSFIINSVIYLVVTLLSFLIFDIDNFWFFSFLIILGFHLIIKSLLFHLDSYCYFGTTLFIAGLLYLYCYFLKIINFYYIFVIISFSISSFICGYIFEQYFHYIISFSIFFIDIFCFLYALNLISIWIFLAILVLNMLILIGSYFLYK